MLGFLDEHADPSSNHHGYRVLGGRHELGRLAACHPGLETDNRISRFAG
jgi:hypothetical protein